MGSHDLKVGFEYLLDIAKYTIDGRSGPIRYRDLNGATDEIQFVDVGDNGDLGTTWAGSNNRDQRYAGYVQDRWNLNSRTTVTARRSAGTTSGRTTWTASAIRSSRTC